jgi:hypothetical protein
MDKPANKGIKDYHKKPLKLVCTVSDKSFVIIDDNIVRALGLNQEQTWLEQEIIDGGILMKIRRAGIIPAG